MALFNFFKKKPEVKITFESHAPSLKALADQRQSELNDRVTAMLELRKNSIPSKNGLYPHEIFMLSCAPTYTTDKTDFPQFWHYDYAVDNPRDLLLSLLNRGFIRKATAKESVEKLKVAELKKILTEQGIQPTGKKEDLVTTVQNNISEESLSLKIPGRKYMLTPLGEQELKENEYVLYFGHSNKYGLTVWDMNRMIQDYPHELFRDKIWAYLNQKKYESMQTLQQDGNLYSFYCREVSANYEISDFQLEENRPLDALKSWVTGFYYDIFVKSALEFKLLSDVEKNTHDPAVRRIKSPETGESALVKDNFPTKFREILSPEYKIKNVETIQTQLQLSDEQLFQQLFQFLCECQAIDYTHLGANTVKLNLPCKDIAGLVVSEINGKKDIADIVFSDIETQIRQN